MGSSTTMTIRVTPGLKERLGRLAQNRHRSRSHLAAEAVEAYVTRELAVMDGVQRGLDDLENGRVSSHADVSAAARQIVDEAKRKRAARP
jgi:predicted transcriptional regulator